MKKRIFDIIFVLIASSLSVYGEDYSSGLGDYATKQYSIIPPSPESSSLMKYLEVPVSHFTGIPQIEIPIYTIEEGSLSLMAVII